MPVLTIWRSASISHSWRLCNLIFRNKKSHLLQRRKIQILIVGFMDRFTGQSTIGCNQLFQFLHTVDPPPLQRPTEFDGFNNEPSRDQSRQHGTWWCPNCVPIVPLPSSAQQTRVPSVEDHVPRIESMLRPTSLIAASPMTSTLSMSRSRHCPCRDTLLTIPTCVKVPPEISDHLIS